MLKSTDFCILTLCPVALLVRSMRFEEGVIVALCCLFIFVFMVNLWVFFFNNHIIYR